MFAKSLSNFNILVQSSITALHKCLDNNGSCKYQSFKFLQFSRPCHIQGTYVDSCRSTHWLKVIIVPRSDDTEYFNLFTPWFYIDLWKSHILCMHAGYVSWHINIHTWKCISGNVSYVYYVGNFIRFRKRLFWENGPFQFKYKNWESVLFVLQRDLNFTNFLL